MKTELTPDLMSKLREPSIARFIFEVAFDWFFIILAIASCIRFPAFYTWVPAFIIIGARQHALNVMGHDGAHRMCCRNRLLNDFLTNIFCFWPFWIGVHSYRIFHFNHHRFNGKKGDPELEHKLFAAPQFDLPADKKRIFYHVFQDLFALNISQLLILIRLFRPAKLSDSLGPVIWWAIVGGLLYQYGLLWALLFWYGAYLTTYWAVFRVRIWTEHVGTPDTHRLSACWWQRFLFVPHYTWCHYEHHHHPAVPCWNLPRLRKIIPGNPIISFKELFNSFQSASPHKSGIPTNQT